MTQVDASKWRSAAEEEMEMLQKLGVWEAVDLPAGRRPISSRWVFCRKKQDGVYSTYKARLVAKGFEQRQGEDFGETWAPTVSHVTVRCLLGVVVQRGYAVWQCDVKTAFLHGAIDKVMYLKQPEGFSDGTSQVWLLHKSLYGLKQSPRCWYGALRGVLQGMGYKKSNADPALFYWDNEGTRAWVAVYVDDLLIVCDEESRCYQTYDHLSNHFTMKRITPVTTYLGLQLEWQQEGAAVTLHQKDYTGRVQAKMIKGVGGGVETPLAQGVDWKAGLKESAVVEERAYKSALGTLSYLSTSTRPDLTYAYSTLAQGTTLRGPTMVKQLGRAAAYFLQQASWGLLYRRSTQPLRLEAYSDADFVLKPDKSLTVAETEAHHHGCSTTGWVILLGGTAVAWKSSKQGTPSDSVCEAEYRSALDAAKEIVWLRYLMEELREPQSAVPLYLDNEACQKLIDGESTRGETKHLVRQYLILRAMVADGEIAPRHVPANQQSADFLTKVVPPLQFWRCRKGCGMVPVGDDVPSRPDLEEKMSEESSSWLQRQGEKPDMEDEDQHEQQDQEDGTGFVSSHRGGV